MKFINREHSADCRILYKGFIMFILFFIVLSDMFSQPEFIGQDNERQVRDKPSFSERLFFGGTFGLQFGTFTDIQVAPVVGIWVLPRIGIAAGPNFRYYKDPFSSTIIYGGKSYIEYLFLQDINNIIPVGLHAGLFLHLEDELLSLESAVFRDPLLQGRFLTNTILAGGGIRQPLGRRSSLNLTFLWAISGQDYGIYSNPEIRISLMF